MKKLISTIEITSAAKYINTPDTFFKLFKKEWQNVKSQVMKLETRQVYDETGNESFDNWMDGNPKSALKLIYTVRNDDVSLYNELKSKKIKFIRCRPVKLPLSNYLLWELECYKFNTLFGENILFLEEEHFLKYAHLANHDFIVFDKSHAFIHNYDKNGKIRGGWEIKDQKDVLSLIALYSKIEELSMDFSLFLLKYKTEL
jgi:hypothetical protein